MFEVRIARVLKGMPQAAEERDVVCEVVPEGRDQGEGYVLYKHSPISLNNVHTLYSHLPCIHLSQKH